MKGAIIETRLLPDVRVRGRSDSKAVHTKAGWFLLTLIVMGGIAPVLAIMSTPTGRTSIWPLVVLELSAVWYAAMVARGRPRLFEMTFWLFVYVFFGMAPMVQARTAIDPSTTPALRHQFDTRAYAIILVGLGAWGLGYVISGGSWRAERKDDPHADIGPRLMRERRVTVAAVVALAFAWYYISQVGFGRLFSSRVALDAARQQHWPDPTTAVLVTAFGTISLAVIVAALLRLRRQSPETGRSRATFLLVLCGATLLVVVNPISSSRIAFGTVALSLVAVLGGFATSRRFRISAVALVAALVLVFPYADMFRYYQPTDLGPQGGPVRTLTTGDFDAFAQIVNTADYVEQRGTTEGRQALGITLFWVPRSLWPDKPRDTGILLAESRGYQFTNLSAPLWAEFYINGSWPVLVLGMATVGWLMRRRDRITANSLGGISVAGSVLPFYMIIMLRGSLLAATAYFIVIWGLGSLLESSSTGDS